MKSLTVIAAALVLLSLPAAAGEIHQAIEVQDIARVTALLEADPSLAMQPGGDRYASLPLHFAAIAGNLEITNLLLEAGAVVDGGDSDNSTALDVACMHGHLEIAEALLTAGASVNHRDQNAANPISFAATAGNWPLIQHLLEAGADLYYRSPRGETLLYKAAAGGMSEFVDHLLENGADLETATEWGETPLGGAARRGRVEMVEKLLAAGADPQAQSEGDDSMLAMCAWTGNVEIAQLLLDRGASPNVPAWHGRTALTMAASREAGELVSLLIDAGAEVNHVKENGATALTEAADVGRLANVESLLAAGAKPDLGHDAQGRNALQLAVTRGHAGIVEALLGAGATTDAKLTPTAAYYGNSSVVNLLEAADIPGSVKKVGGRSLADLSDVDRGEAVVWFLDHSGWVVKTQQHLLVFDAWQRGPAPTDAGLCNGCVSPAEIADEKVVVFVSHHHGDHFDRRIFDWREQIDDITYYLGLEPEEAPEYTLMRTREVIEHDGLKITPHHSTDAGVGMVVEVDGVVIHHPGDHANGTEGLMPDFTAEIDFLVDAGIRPDITFFGIRGCSLGAPDQVKRGIQYVLETMRPRSFLPMHASRQGNDYLDFVNEILPQFPDIPMFAPQNGGDHFVFTDGTLTAPKGAPQVQVSAVSKPGCETVATATCSD